MARLVRVDSACLVLARAVVVEARELALGTLEPLVTEREPELGKGLDRARVRFEGTGRDRRRCGLAPRK